MTRFGRPRLSLLLVGLVACRTFLLGAATADESNLAQAGIEGLRCALIPASDRGNGRLKWSTASESGIVGFDVLVAVASGAAVVLNSDLIPAANSAAGGSYSWEFPRTWDDQSLADAPTFSLRIWRENGQCTLHPLRPDLDSHVAAEEIPSIKAPGADSPSLFESVTKPARPAVKSASEPTLGFDAFTGTEGVYGIRAADLATALDWSLAQVRSGLSQHTLAFTTDGRPLAWTLSADKDGCLIYLPEKRNVYQHGNVFQSSAGVSPDLSIRNAKVARAGASLLGGGSWNIESDLLAVTTLPGGVEDDFWVWDSYLGNHPLVGTRTYLLSLAQLAPNSSSGELVVDLASTSEATHLFQATLNGRDLGSTNWIGRRLITWTIPLTPADLKAGTNQLVLASRGDRTSLCYLDRLRVSSDRFLVVENGSLAFTSNLGGRLSVRANDGRPVTVWDVTVPEAPVVLDASITKSTNGSVINYRTAFQSQESHRYVAFRADAPQIISRWQSVRGFSLKAPLEIDYLIVSPEVLLEPARRLAIWRESQGLRTRVVTLTQVRHEFSAGNPNPDALRQLLIYARNHWETVPQYVVLLGDGTYDYRSVLGGVDNLQPPPLVLTTFGRAAADSLNLDVSTAATAIGRLPAKTSAELEGIIDRLMAYEATRLSTALPGALLLADQPDVGGEFIRDSDTLANVVAGIFAVNKDYNNGIGSAVVQTQLRALLSSGMTWWNYLGHGGRDRMGADYVTIPDVPGLNFGPVSPLVTGMTCAMGQFALPGLDCLGEALVLKKGIGPIAVWSPSGFSVNYQASLLNRLFAEELIHARSVDRLGDIIRRSRNRFLQGGGDAVTPEFYNLLGDPALKLPFAPVARQPHLVVNRDASGSNPPALNLIGETGSEYRIEVMDPGQSDHWEPLENVRINSGTEVRTSVFLDARHATRLFRAVRQ